MVEDLIRRDGFSFRLRLGMVIADIRTSEMATEIGVCDSAIREKYMPDIQRLTAEND